MRKRILSFALALVMCVGLTACGGGTNAEMPDPENAAGTVSDGGTQEVVQPEPEPEPELPYAEENGFAFSNEKNYTSSAFTWFEDENGNPKDYDGLSISGAVDATYAIGDISVSDADADGMVTLTIPYNISFGTTVAADNSIYGGEEFRFHWACETLELFDYYTGTKIDREMDEGEVIDITYQDVTCPVTCTTSSTITGGEFSEWIDAGGNIYEDRRNYSIDVAYTVTMPKDYDGLCLYLDLPGKTEPSVQSADEGESDSSKVELLLEGISAEGKNINDYALIRISDLM